MPNRSGRGADHFPGDFGGAFGGYGVDRIVFESFATIDLHDIRR
ncbi:hypothetical protein [Hoeflea olei]|nr:hypothetical protein [Hoeflea olei]